MQSLIATSCPESKIFTSVLLLMSTFSILTPQSVLSWKFSDELDKFLCIFCGSIDCSLIAVADLVPCLVARIVEEIGMLFISNACKIIHFMNNVKLCQVLSDCNCHELPSQSKSVAGSGLNLVWWPIHQGELLPFLKALCSVSDSSVHLLGFIQKDPDLIREQFSILFCF